MMADLLVPYEAPSWAKTLKIVQKSYIKLAQRDTPIHDWSLPGVSNGFKVSIKRDDMTGSVLAGNKIRKLEFLLADAISQKYDSVITCGGIQSNHCRATALACKMAGLKCHLLLRTEEPVKDQENCFANVLMDRLAGAQIYLIPEESLEGGLLDRMKNLADKLWNQRGENAYSVPLGGSSAIGTFGYIEAFQEMIKQGVLENFDDIVLSLGSGGTVTGLAIANYLTGSKLKIHAVCVCDNADHFYKHVSHSLDEFGLVDIEARDICDIIDAYQGKGYAKSTDADLEMLIEISQSTGVILDPVYTLKAVRGMLEEMRINPSRFKGKRVLFLHTGGYYAIFDGRINDLLMKGDASQNKEFVIWTDTSKDPLQN